MTRSKLSSAGLATRLLAGLVLSLVAAVTMTTLRSVPESAPSTDTEQNANDATAAPPMLSDEQRAQPDTRQTPADAGEAEDNAETGAATRTAAVRADDRNTSPRVGRSMSEIIELLNADNFADARAQLDELMQADVMSQMTRYERARVYQLSFNLNMQDEAYEAAQSDLQAAIESGGLNEKEVSQLTYQSAQLFVQQEDYVRAADSLELWIAQEGATANPAAYYLLAASYYYQDKFDDARDHIETLMSMPGAKQEGWYSMAATLYLRDEDYAKAKPVMEKMVELYGDQRYRDQLRGINEAMSKGQ